MGDMIPSNQQAQAAVPSSESNTPYTDETEDIYVSIQK